MAGDGHKLGIELLVLLGQSSQLLEPDTVQLLIRSPEPVKLLFAEIGLIIIGIKPQCGVHLIPVPEACLIHMEGIRNVPLLMQQSCQAGQLPVSVFR
ncbi:hypothetical protein D3C75_1035450 [compost metagenome]